MAEMVSVGCLKAHAGVLMGASKGTEIDAGTRRLFQLAACVIVVDS